MRRSRARAAVKSPLRARARRPRREATAVLGRRAAGANERSRCVSSRWRSRGVRGRDLERGKIASTIQWVARSNAPRCESVPERTENVPAITPSTKRRTWALPGKKRASRSFNRASLPAPSTGKAMAACSRVQRNVTGSRSSLSVNPSMVAACARAHVEIERRGYAGRHLPRCVAKGEKCDEARRGDNDTAIQETQKVIFFCSIHFLSLAWVCCLGRNSDTPSAESEHVSYRDGEFKRPLERCKLLTRWVFEYFDQTTTGVVIPQKRKPARSVRTWQV